MMNTPIVVNRQQLARERPPQTSSFTLLFYAGGIYASYLLYGYFQEYLMKEGRFGPEQEKYNYNAFLLFVQGLCNLIFAYLAIWSSGEPVRDSVPFYSYALSAGSQLAAMSFSFYALQFVDYPTQALAKACKPIPVMIMGLLVFQKRYHWSKYITVSIITGGIAVFMKEQEFTHYGKADDPGLYGFGMLLISLAMDGVTGPIQDNLVSKHKPSANHLMFHTNLWGCLWSLIVLIFMGEIGPALAFGQRNPDVWFYVIGQSLASAVGQLFIFRLIRLYGALTLSIITTTRKFFSILLSIVYFGHTLTTLQWTSVLAVFLGLSYDMIAPKAASSHHSQHGHGHHHHHHHGHHDHHHGHAHQHEHNSQKDDHPKHNGSKEHPADPRRSPRRISVRSAPSHHK